MKVKVTRTENFEISTKEANKIALQYLEKTYNLNRHQWIKDENLMHNVVYHTSHAWDEDEVLREATKQDKAVLKIIKELQVSYEK